MDHHCRILCGIWFQSLFSTQYWKLQVFLNFSNSAWLNNCVGHFNHRYFFSFCLFMTLGCVYCSISGRNLFLDAYNALEVRWLDSHNTVESLSHMHSHEENSAIGAFQDEQVSAPVMYLSCDLLMSVPSVFWQQAHFPEETTLFWKKIAELDW